jgi:Galactose oxidase, central domain
MATAPAPATAYVQSQPKLVGSGATAGYVAQQGTSLALSADGLTACVGGPDDDKTGSLWFFNRNVTSGKWVQVGTKVTASDYNGLVSSFGYSCSLNYNGTVAVVGGYYDYNSVGSTWVFTLANGKWSQQTLRLAGNDYNDPQTIGVQQGTSVSLASTTSNVFVTGTDLNCSFSRSSTYLPSCLLT